MKGRLTAIVFGMLGVFLSTLAGVGQDDLGLAKPGESIRLVLLRSAEVRKELEITDAQKAKIDKIGDTAKETRKSVESVYKGQEKAKSSDPEAKQAEELQKAAMNQEFEALGQQAEGELNRALTSKQRTRLTQIVLRVEGPSAFVKPELIKALNLGPDQVEAIQEVLDGRRASQEQYKESAKQSFELAKSSGDGDLEKLRKDQSKGEMRSYAYKLHKQVMAQITRVLSRHQRDRYNAMLGPPFDLLKLTDREGRPLLANPADLGASLLRNPAVQEELKLTDKQKEQLTARAVASKVLDSRQKERLNQIVLQGEGSAALLRPDVVRALRLTDDQVEQIQEQLDGLGTASRDLHESQKEASRRLRDAQGVEPDPVQEKTRKEQEKQQWRTASADLRGRTMRQITATLSRKQKTAFDKLLGEPFDFSKLRVSPDAGKDADVPAKTPRPVAPR